MAWGFHVKGIALNQTLFIRNVNLLEINLTKIFIKMYQMQTPHHDSEGSKPAIENWQQASNYNTS